MKMLLSVLLLCCAVAVCAQPVPVKVRPLQDYYYIGLPSWLQPGLNCFAITERKDFERFFGTTNRPDTPAFEKEIMLVLLMPESKMDSKLSFEKVDMKAGNFIEVYCSYKLNKGRLPYSTNPIATCAIPRMPGVTKLNFYKENSMRLLKTVEVK